jgi:hypothetical protein
MGLHGLLQGDSFTFFILQLYTLNNAEIGRLYSMDWKIKKCIENFTLKALR